jgi:hypothetical protein
LRRDGPFADHPAEHKVGPDPCRSRKLLRIISGRSNHCSKRQSSSFVGIAEIANTAEIASDLGCCFKVVSDDD